jgi:hypothetical protein
MKRACLLLLLAAVFAAPAASLAGGPPGPPPRPQPPGAPQSSPVQSIAAALCIAEFKQLGETAFKAKYPTRDSCMQAHAAQAAQIAESCKSAADPRACVREAVGAPEEKPEGTTAKPGSKPQGSPQTALVRKVAESLCRAEYKTLGADGFKQKYRTPAGCMRQMAPKAAAIVKAAVAQCSTSQNKSACVMAAIAKALGLPARPQK